MQELVKSVRYLECRCSRYSSINGLNFGLSSNVVSGKTVPRRCLREKIKETLSVITIETYTCYYEQLSCCKDLQACVSPDVRTAAKIHEGHKIVCRERSATVLLNA